MAGFYSAYAHPMEGRVNPMELAAVVGTEPPSIFDDAAFESGETRRNRRGKGHGAPPHPPLFPSHPLRAPASPADLFAEDHFYEMIQSVIRCRAG
jgi:hypothetical protein